MGMIKFRAPALPIPTPQYSAGQQDQLMRALQIYFSQLDSLTPLQAEYFKGRGDQLVQPYALIFSEVDQGSAGITSENLVEYDQPMFSNGITIVDDTKIYFPYPGEYAVTFRLEFANRGNAAQIIEVWAKDGNTNYPLSNTRADIDARKSLSVYSHAVVTKSGIFTVANIDTDYLQIAWWSDGADIYLESYPAGTNPTRPVCPSVIMTINLVSAIP